MKFIIANWKMNMDSKSIKEWFDGFNLKTRETVIIAPPFAYLAETKTLLKNDMQLAGQDVSQFEKGAHTGELGAYELKEFADYCIVGHSERHETAYVTLQKISACLAYKITPIVCFVDKSFLKQISQIQSCIVCWEDPQNISQNGVYAPKNVAEISAEVENIKTEWPNVTLLYGGSVNRQNILELVNIDKLDGVLVGNASLDPAHFTEIVKIMALRA